MVGIGSIVTGGYRWHGTRDKGHMTCDTWHMTCDMWHKTLLFSIGASNYEITRHNNIHERKKSDM